MDKHPITPPPELVQQWLNAIFDEDGFSIDPRKLSTGLATRAAQWGYQQAVEELKAFLRKDHDKS